jgi:membrane-associated phospholipid phosphatase
VNVAFGRRRADWLLPGIAVVCAALAWAFTHVGSEVTEGDLSAMDRAVRAYVISHQSSAATTFFSVITMLGNKPLIVVMGVLVGWLLSKRSKTLVLVTALCGLVSAEFVDVLKEGFGVARPPASTPSRSLSFPSGHVTGAASIATLLSYVAWRRKVAVPWVVSLSALLVLLMAMSRVYLDRHWASDTIGGSLVGVALGLLGCSIYEVVERPKPANFPE